MEIVIRNANQMFSEMFWRFKVSGIEVSTRNGPALRIGEPVLTTVSQPRERVLFHPGRDANPVFHLMESIYMLAGREDVQFPALFNYRISQYSDDGKIFNAAYGRRWRSYFGCDQLVDVIELLKRDSESRQAVVQMWSASDLVKSTKDKACNTQLIFEILHGRLNMTVINRSNDAWFGYAGANIVHMTFLQEFVAQSLKVPLGVYRTFSTNLHLYKELYDSQRFLKSPPQTDHHDHYLSGEVEPLPIMLNADYRGFLTDCERFCENPFLEREYSHPFFEHVAYPMAMISHFRKNKYGTGEGWAAKVQAEDWRRAAFEWIQRRESAKR
jgi:hypothetical protein